MPRTRAYAVKPGKPSKRRYYTPGEEAERDTHEQAVTEQKEAERQVAATETREQQQEEEVLTAFDAWVSVKIKNGTDMQKVGYRKIKHFCTFLIKERDYEALLAHLKNNAPALISLPEIEAIEKKLMKITR